MKLRFALVVVFAFVHTEASAEGIRILSATYGANCGATPDNVLHHVQEACGSRRDQCTYAIDVNRVGDPAKRCSKSFELSYQCGRHGQSQSQTVEGEAHGKSVSMDCRARSGGGTLRVTEATYGANCGVPAGNVTAAVAQACNGKGSCSYSIDVNQLGDPARKCGKNFALYYECNDQGYVYDSGSSYVPPEAHGQTVSVSCGGRGRSSRAIEVLSASYGENCRGRNSNNAIGSVAKQCDGKAQCTYRVDLQVLGDPASGCTKDFSVRYRCHRNGDERVTRTPFGVEAAGRDVTLICRGGR